MTTNGGGWPLVSQGIPVSNSALSLCNTGAVGALDLEAFRVRAPAKLADAAINAIWATGPGRELLVKQARDVNDGNATAWSQVCKADFVNGHTWSSAAGGAALAQLQSAQITCSPGSSWTANAVWSGQYCGYSFENATAARYLIYSVNTSYSGGTCTTNNAGRSWTQEGNWGCNTSRHFIR